MAKEIDNIKMWESMYKYGHQNLSYSNAIPYALAEQGFKFDGEHIVPIKECKGNNGGISHNLKEGDWIVDSTDRRREPMQIKNILTVGYTTEQGSFIDFKEENNFHLWSIDDAKDGDVLVCDDFGYTSLLLFESFSNGRISLHFWYNSQTNNFNLNTDVALKKDANIHSASKEQRDLLFKKMKEAGLAWDAENKQLLNLSNVERTGKDCKELTEFEKELAKIIGFGVSTAVVNPKEGVDEFAKKYAPKLMALARKQIAEEIVKQYTDKGEKNYQDSKNGYECDRAAICYWDGFRDCANAIKRELED